MACDVEKGLAVLAFANAVASTPGAAFGEVVPPAEPLLLARMWISWFGLVFTLKKLADCLDENGQGNDAESVRRRLRRVEEEMDKIKHGIKP
jgi:hypothetical protein